MVERACDRSMVDMMDGRRRRRRIDKQTDACRATWGERERWAFHGHTAVKKGTAK